MQFLNFRTICVVHLCKSDKKSLHVSGYLLTKYVDLTMNNLYLNSNFSGLLSFYLGRKIHNDVSFRFVKHDFHPITYTKLYIPSTLNIDLILWLTQLIVCAVKFKSWVISFTFQAYTLSHTLNCICVLNFMFEFKAVSALPKMAHTIRKSSKMIEEH